ncbi:hypothetical protein LC608_33960 [Nostoc sp. XA010]|uniref:hypothetical protein n=1 Tax=Nostoc sp. XA010 TaxID=2780407 RepID=UPI001E5745E7|nr:hypothetical protein [Nostoc sp. XA010]MCC5661863.1 hypothetical protein [Nostoc sp. XA010]
MANCPNCGSTHIQLKRETNVSWGRAITGLALFGVVGGAVGAVTGEDRNANACLDCGTSWKAEDLYKILQIIKKSTDINPDMTTATDRLFVNDFILEMTPYIEAMSKAQKESETIVTVSENKKSLFAAAGCGSGCIITLILWSIFAFASVFIGSGFFLIIPTDGYFISMFRDTFNRQNIEKEIKNSKREAARMNTEAKNNFKRKAEQFADSHW